MRVEEPDDEVIDGQQRRGADDAAGDAVVFADDRVLHGVGQREQHDQVERVELRQFAFAREAQADDEENVNHDRPQHLLRDRQPPARTYPRASSTSCAHANPLPA